MIYAVIHSRHRGVTILFTDILCEQVVSFSLFTALHFLHQIHIAQSRMLSTDTRCSQNLRQLDRSTITKYSRKPLFQFLMNDSGGEWQTIRFIQHGRRVYVAYNVFYGVDMIVCAIMTLQSMFFLLVEPVTGTCKQFLFQLGVDLWMFNSGTVNIMFRFNADESAAACRIAQ